jgi:predicted metal-dependent HD superfamily phosphohydrolase
MDFSALKTYILERLTNELPGNLFYHTVDHTLDVLDAVKHISSSENITKTETMLLKTAAVMHDFGFIIQYTCNEIVACKFADEILPSFNYSGKDIKIINAMIMATKIPQTPQNNLEKIICDADLDYLGRPDFFPISEKLRKELAANGKKFSDKEWLQFEINFIEKHNFFTETAHKLRHSQKIQHLSDLKNQLNTL